MAMLRTARLTLREMTDADLDDLTGLLGDEAVMSYYPRPKSRPEVENWIAWNRQLYRDRGFGLWILSRADTGVFLGECGLTVQHVDGVAEVEVGYHVLPEHQGRGYATEAAATCRELARTRFDLDRLIAIIHPDNLPSQAVAKKIGLTPQKHIEVRGEKRAIYAAAL